jgi:hypothetical protein
MERLYFIPDHPAAILRVDSHSDRSFFGDRGLALLSEALREDGMENDLVDARPTRSTPARALRNASATVAPANIEFLDGGQLRRHPARQLRSPARPCGNELEQEHRLHCAGR